MPPSDAERLATIEQVLRDVRADVDELRVTRREDHHRLRDVESSVSLMLEAHKDARRAEDAQYRRLEVRIQVLSISIGLGGLLMAVAVAVLGH